MRIPLLPLILAYCLVAQVCVAADGELRTWTDVSGRTVEGVLVEAGENEIKLRVASGKVFPIPLENLSAGDREYLKELKENAPPGEWPDKVEAPDDIEVDKVKEDRDKEEFVYRTPHFQFEAQERLSESVIKEFCRIFEATFEVVKQVPLGLKPQPPEGHFKTELYPSRAAYFDAGGPTNSGGVYMGGEKKIMIPLANLGVRNTGVRYIVDRDHDNGTLKHEITHQVMHRWLGKTRPWFIEGIADYMEAAEYRQGRYSFNRIRDAVRESATERTSKDDETTMFKLEPLMALTLPQWNMVTAENVQAGSMNYKSSMLLVYYFLHLDGEGERAGIRGYLTAVDKGLGERAAMEKFLLRGRSFEELEADVAKAWKSDRLEVTFVSPPYEVGETE